MVDQAAAKAELSTAELENWMASASTISGPRRSAENPQKRTFIGRFFRLPRHTLDDPDVVEIFDAACKLVEAGGDAEEVARKAGIDVEQVRAYEAWVNDPIGPKGRW